MKKILIIVLALALICGSCYAEAPAILSAEEIYDEHEPIYYDAWHADHDGYTIADGMRAMGIDMMDFDAFTRSEMGDYAFGLLLPFLTYGDDITNADNIAYWESAGMKYEYHDLEDHDRQWVSLTPLNLEEGKKYPVLFVWHGNGNAIMVVEHYGYGELAAQEQWIVIVPYAKNDDIYLEEFDRIMGVLKAEYPIDETRIYTTGFSKGGSVSQRLAFERSDVIAAAVANGSNAKWGFNPVGEGLIAEEGKEYEYAVPIAFFGGEYDYYWAMYYETEEEIGAVNKWMKMVGLEPNQSLDLSRNLRKSSADETMRRIGLKFDETRTLHEDGADVWIGDIKDKNGVTLMRFAEQGGAVHSPTHFMCEYTMDFLRNFAKDPETGRTEYVGK